MNRSRYNPNKGSWRSSRGSQGFAGDADPDAEGQNSRRTYGASSRRQGVTPDGEGNDHGAPERREPEFAPGAITSLEVQKGNPDRVSVFVDEQFLMGVKREVAYHHGLKKGLTVTVDFLREVWRDEEGHQARDLAAKYLGMKARTRKQLTDYLLGKGFDETVTERTLEWLIGYGYLDDSQFARQWVENRTKHRPRGKAMLRWELQQKGVSRHDIDEAITEEFQGDVEVEAAVQLLQKKVGRRSLEFSYEERQKLAQYLARRGFSASVTSDALRRFRERANLDND